MKSGKSVIANMINDDRTFEVCISSVLRSIQMESIPLITTTTKQRALGFITRTKNLWKDYDTASALNFEVFKLTTVQKGKKFIDVRTRVEIRVE